MKIAVVCLVYVQYGCCRFGVAFRVSRWVRSRLVSRPPSPRRLPWPGGSVSSPTPHCRAPFPRWLRLSAAWLRLLHKTSPPPPPDSVQHACLALHFAPVTHVGLGCSARHRRQCTISSWVVWGQWETRSAWKIPTTTTTTFAFFFVPMMLSQPMHCGVERTVSCRCWRVVAGFGERSVGSPPPSRLSLVRSLISIHQLAVYYYCLLWFFRHRHRWPWLSTDSCVSKDTKFFPNFFQISTIIVNFHRIFAIFIPRR